MIKSGVHGSTQKPVSLLQKQAEEGGGTVALPCVGGMAAICD
jgi:hypothetical protein